MNKSTASILIAEDIHLTLDNYKIEYTALDPPPYARVTFAANGLEAVKAVLADRYDVAVLDVRMPSLSGDEVMRIITALQPGIKVFFLTGAFTQAQVLELLRRQGLTLYTMGSKTGMPIAIKGTHMSVFGELKDAIDCILDERYEDLPEGMFASYM